MGRETFIRTDDTGILLSFVFNEREISMHTIWKGNILGQIFVLEQDRQSGNSERKNNIMMSKYNQLELETKITNKLLWFISFEIYVALISRL